MPNFTPSYSIAYCLKVLSNLNGPEQSFQFTPFSSLQPVGLLISMSVKESTIHQVAQVRNASHPRHSSSLHISFTGKFCWSYIWSRILHLASLTLPPLQSNPIRHLSPIVCSFYPRPLKSLRHPFTSPSSKPVVKNHPLKTKSSLVFTSCSFKNPNSFP